MSISFAPVLVTGFVLATAAGVSAASAGPDPLASYRWTSRVLVVLAPDGADRALAEQRRLFGAARPGDRERDLILVEGVGAGPDAARLRGRFRVEPSAFAAILVGKDGGEKLRSAEPIASETLFATIDAMPMRRDEMSRQRR